MVDITIYSFLKGAVLSFFQCPTFIAGIHHMMALGRTKNNLWYEWSMRFISILGPEVTFLLAAACIGFFLNFLM